MTRVVAARELFVQPGRIGFVKTDIISGMPDKVIDGMLARTPLAGWGSRRHSHLPVPRLRRSQLYQRSRAARRRRIGCGHLNAPAMAPATPLFLSASALKIV